MTLRHSVAEIVTTVTETATTRDKEWTELQIKKNAKFDEFTIFVLARLAWGFVFQNTLTDFPSFVHNVIL